jgi:hypothetical protein
MWKFQRPSQRRRAVFGSLAAGAVALSAAVLVSTPGNAATGCSVGYVVNQWTGGFTANLTVSGGSNPLHGWTVTWTYPSGQKVTSAWNATVTQSGTAVTAVNLSYNGEVPANGSTQFGFQGTWGSSNPAPTDFAVNGVLCNGSGTPSTTAGTTGTPTRTATATPTRSATSSPTPSLTPTRSATPSASPTPSPTPSATPTPSLTPTTSGPPTGCGSAVICDGFESLPVGPPSGSWSLNFPNCSGTGTAAIDNTMAHSGSKSLKITGTANYCNHVFVKNSANVAFASQQWYFRAYIRHTTALGQQHVTFLAMADSADNNNDLRFGGQGGALQWNRQSDDATLPEQSPTGIALSVPLATNTWSCVEFHVDGTTGQMQTWVNSSEVAGLHEDGVPTHDIDSQWLSRANWRPRLTDLRLGWEAYGDGTDTLWFDDVAFGPARIGC